MSHWNHLAHLLHLANDESKHGNHKRAGVVYVVAGLFLTPWLIGIPLLIYGIYKLTR